MELLTADLRKNTANSYIHGQGTKENRPQNSGDKPAILSQKNRDSVHLLNLTFLLAELMLLQKFFLWKISMGIYFINIVIKSPARKEASCKCDVSPLSAIDIAKRV